MIAPNREDVLKCSASTLMTIYYVIVGLAITEGLQKAFIEEGKFVGSEAFSTGNLPKTLLFFAMLPTICRFVHGASMHLGVLGNKRYKPLVDFASFCFQATMFYLMAFSLGDVVLFSSFFVVLLGLDTLWLMFLRVIRYVEINQTIKQWLTSNIILILLLLGGLLFTKSIPSAVQPSLVTGVAILATIWDYVANREFYFPKE